jgi:hypothetical protein
VAKLQPMPLMFGGIRDYIAVTEKTKWSFKKHKHFEFSKLLGFSSWFSNSCVEAYEGIRISNQIIKFFEKARSPSESIHL